MFQCLQLICIKNIIWNTQIPQQAKCVPCNGSLPWLLYSNFTCLFHTQQQTFEYLERTIAQHWNITVKSQLHPGDAVTALMNFALSHCVYRRCPSNCSLYYLLSEVLSLKRPHCGLFSEFFKQHFYWDTLCFTKFTYFKCTSQWILVSL